MGNRRAPYPDRAHGQQVGLPFDPRGRSGPSPPLAALDLRAGTHESPDAYALVLRALLDHGELGLHHVRAVLDAAGGSACALGSYVEMALRRGDAVRTGAAPPAGRPAGTSSISQGDDRIVATAAAVRRREVADDPVQVALGDPDYRAWIDRIAAGTRLPARDVARFAPWDVRLIGARLTGPGLSAAIERVLPGRRLDAIPIARPAETPPQGASRTFLDSFGEPLALSFPSSLATVAGGLAAANGLLAGLRTAPAKVRLPGPLDPRVRVHGGLLHPGESPPASIPDLHSLRLRALRCVPGIAMLAALLLDPDIEVGLPPDPASDATVRAFGRDLGALGPLLGLLADRAGWLAIRPSHMTPWIPSVAIALDIAVAREGRLTLPYALSERLRADPVTRPCYDDLMRLHDRLRSAMAAQAP